MSTPIRPAAAKFQRKSLQRCAVRFGFIGACTAGGNGNQILPCLLQACDDILSRPNQPERPIFRAAGMTDWRRVPFQVAAFATGVRDSYWFVPALLALIGLVAGILLVGIDTRFGAAWLSGSEALHGNRPEGARAMLTTIAGSTITVAGVVFSITLAAVTYAAGQHGSRLLTNFARDKGNQVTLGVFIGTYVYCLVVLRTVRSAGETGRANDYFVPQLSVYVALGLALASIAMLIYFVHHVTQTIHINNVIARIGESLIAEVRANAVAEAVRGSAGPWGAGSLAREAVIARKIGYVQGIDYAALAALAEKHGVVGRVECQPGDFVDCSRTVFSIFTDDPAAIGDPEPWLSAFTIGSRKTDLQDLRFGFDELNEIATRALSPGINDPFTAIACIDWMGAALSEYDRAMVLMPANPPRSRIAAVTRTFEDYLEASLGRLRQHALGDASVAATTVRTLSGVAAASTIAAHRAALLQEQARYVNRQEA